MNTSSHNNSHNSVPDAYLYKYQGVFYGRIFNTPRNSSCALHALIGERVDAEYIWSLSESINPENLLQCFNANIRILKNIPFEDSRWECILAIYESKIELLRSFMIERLELCGWLIYKSSRCLNLDEVKLAVEILLPNTKVLIFYSFREEPIVIHPQEGRSTIAIEHEVAYRPDGPHLARLDCLFISESENQDSEHFNPLLQRVLFNAELCELNQSLGLPSDPNLTIDKLKEKSAIFELAKSLPNSSQSSNLI